MRSSANEALVCPPERDRLGGPPERSEGGEGARMAGPLRAHVGSGLCHIKYMGVMTSSPGIEIFPFGMPVTHIPEDTSRDTSWKDSLSFRMYPGH